jgi:phosphoglycerol transferase
MNSFFKNIGNKNLVFFIATLVFTLFILTIIIKPWQVDLRLPLFAYQDDNLFFHFTIKTIVDNGWFEVNKFVGMPYEFNISDFPVHSDLSYMLILKVLSYFSSNIYLISNCFFIIGFLMISATSFIALRAMKIEHFICLVISILYSFLPFHFYWNTEHAFNANYYVIPLVIMMSLWLIDNEVSAISYINGKLSFNFNLKSYICLLIALLASICGVYYAYYSCIILSFTWLIRIFKNEKNNYMIIIIIMLIIMASFYLQIPSFKYWAEYGTNSMVSYRSVIDSDTYGLRLVYLFLPLENHYFKYFANIGNHFLKLNQLENRAESLGIIGSIGFLFLLLWLFVKSYDCKESLLQKTIDKFSLSKKDQNLISDLAGLNLLSVLFASAGGLVMFIAISFPVIRAHARFSVFIGFISLSLIAILINQLYKKTNHRIIFNIVLVVALLFAIIDQVGIQNPQNKQIEKINNDSNFVAKIKNILPQNSAIFILPIAQFPEGISYDILRPYLVSKNLRWSSPAVYGRKANLWQEKVTKYGFSQFIKEIKYGGFAGVYIDRSLYLRLHDSKNLANIEAKLQSVAKMPKLVSSDNQLVFFALF